MHDRLACAAKRININGQGLKKYQAVKDMERPRMSYGLFLLGLAGAAGVAYASLRQQRRQRVLNILTQEERAALAIYNAIAKAISEINGKPFAQVALTLARLCDPNSKEVLRALERHSKKFASIEPVNTEDVTNILLRARAKYSTTPSHRLQEELELYVTAVGSDTVSKIVISTQKDPSDVFHYVREELFRGGVIDKTTTIQIYPRDRAEESENEQ
jgi:hypothetical protein